MDNSFGFKPGGTSAATNARLDLLENTSFKIAYYAEITTTSGQISIPAEEVVLLDQWENGVDAILSAIPDGAGTKPDYFDTGLDVSTFDVLGNYVVNGSLPTNPSALIYYISVKLKNFSSLNQDRIIEYVEIKDEFADLKIGDVVNGNYSEFETDGTPVMHGNATVHDDLRVSPNSLPSLGSNPPIPEIVANDGSATTGSALDFNGTNSVGNVAYYSSLDVTHLTIALWVKPDDVNSRELIDRNMSGGYEFYINSNKVTFALTGSQTVNTPNNSIISGATQLLVLTARQEGSNTRIKIYINNTLQVESVVNSVINTGLGGLVIGEWRSGGWNYNGIMDDIQLYNIILTDAQISEIYNNGAGIVGLPTGVVEATDLVARFQNSLTNTAPLGAAYDITDTNITIVGGLIGITTGSFGVSLDAYLPGVVMEKFFTIQHPHGKLLRDVANGIDGTIFSHVHWYAADLTVGNVVWKLEYAWNQAGMSIPDTIIVDRVVSNNTVGDPLNNNKPLQRMNNVPETGINPPMDVEHVSSTLICRLYRDGTDVRDTYQGKVYLHEFDAHVEYDMTGSRNVGSK